MESVVKKMCSGDLSHYGTDVLCLSTLMVRRAVEILSSDCIEDKSLLQKSVAIDFVGERADVVVNLMTQLALPTRLRTYSPSHVETDTLAVSSRVHLCRKALDVLGEAAWVMCRGRIEGGSTIERSRVIPSQLELLRDFIVKSKRRGRDMQWFVDSSAVDTDGELAKTANEMYTHACAMKKV